MTEHLSALDHDAPNQEPSLPEMHDVLEEHDDCALDDCPKKLYCWMALIDRGHLHINEPVESCPQCRPDTSYP